TTTETKPAAEVPQPFITAEEAKNFGFDSPEALKTFIQKSKEGDVSAEQKEKRENQEKANIIKFAADNDLMKVEDFNKLEDLRKLSDMQIAYNKFEIEFLEDNPDAKPEDIKTAFDQEYHLNSENEKAKLRGEARIKKEATEIRQPLEKSYTNAK